MVDQAAVGCDELRCRDMKKFRSVDEVLDFAKKREIEAHNFYMKLADFVEKPEIAKVLSDLALPSDTFHNWLRNFLRFRKWT
jgi:rubrerythrin